MVIKFFKSKNCPDCPKAEINVNDVLSELKITENVEIYDISTNDGLIEALNNMVMASPALVLENKILDKSVLLDKNKLKALIQERNERHKRFD